MTLYENGLKLYR